MLIAWNNVKVLGEVMSKLMKIYNFRSDLFVEDDSIKLIIDFEYGEINRIYNLFHFWLSMFLEKNIINHCCEIPNDLPKDNDLCKFVIKLKF